MERAHCASRAADLAGEARKSLCAEEAAADVGGDAAEDLRLLRRHEPVLRFTRGELFLPMSVSAYLERCGLWQAAESGRSRRRRAAAVRLCAPGELTPERLAEAGAAPHVRDLSLRFVERPLTRSEYRSWRREPGRARLAPGSGRFAVVGLVGRLIDAGFRLSLLIRGRVPGGTTAAAEQNYRARAGHDSYAYYGHVTRDRGFVTLQYWFLYAMNDWRSTFGGVNDHEADWEQVTVFLPDPPEPVARPAWVAFSSHDEVGDDLRRRQDDPDLEWRDTHPVVFVGAGSHSGACLPGDYVVTVEPAAFRRVLAAWRRLSRPLLPWTRDREGTAFGIPFIDYRRGDGLSVGPGEERGWSPVLIDDTTPWLRDYRGLWGLETGDPFGGERAPAGPRYERTGSVRRCWSDPVGWAGLDKVSPTPGAELQAVKDRTAELDGQIAAARQELDARTDELRNAQVGVRALRDLGMSADPARFAGLEASVEQVRLRHRALTDEREALARASLLGLATEDPHAHLHHRALPNVAPVRARKRVLRIWSNISASLLLAGFAVIVLGVGGALLPALAGLAVVILCTEAFARGHLLQFIAVLLAVALAGTAIWVITLAAIGHWRVAAAALFALAALALLTANIRDFFSKRLTDSACHQPAWVGQCLRDWLETLNTQAESTVTGYRIMVRYLVELIGNVKLAELKVRDVDFALGELAKRLSTRSVRLARMILIQATRNAMVNDLVVRNVADLAALPTGSPVFCTSRGGPMYATDVRLRAPLPSRWARCSRAEERQTEAKADPIGYQDLDRSDD